MAKEIRRNFPEERLHLVSVLKGGVFLLTDLARNIPGEVSFDFIAVASYGQNTHSSRQVRLTRDLDSSIEGRTLIVVEDILDTGMTLQYLAVEGWPGSKRTVTATRPLFHDESIVQPVEQSNHKLKALEFKRRLVSTG